MAMAVNGCRKIETAPLGGRSKIKSSTSVLATDWYNLSKMPNADSSMVEGPEAYKRFEAVMKKVIAVPRAVVQQRIEEQRTQAQVNPNKRGPKPKTPAA